MKSEINYDLAKLNGVKPTPSSPWGIKFLTMKADFGLLCNENFETEMWDLSTLQVNTTVFWDVTPVIWNDKFHQNCVTSLKTVITKNKVLLCRHNVFGNHTAIKSCIYRPIVLKTEGIILVFGIWVVRISAETTTVLVEVFKIFFSSSS
jgi:hypothetical protein